MLQCLLGHWLTRWPGVPQRKQADSFCTNGHTQIKNGEEPLESLAHRLTAPQRSAHFGLGAVFGEMSVLVAVPALHVLGGVISVGGPLYRYAAVLGFVVDPGLRQKKKNVTCNEYGERKIMKKLSKLSCSTSVSTRSLSPRRSCCVLTLQSRLHDWMISMTVLGCVLTSLSLSDTNQEPPATSSTSGTKSKMLQMSNNYFLINKII